MCVSPPHQHHLHFPRHFEASPQWTNMISELEILNPPTCMSFTQKLQTFKCFQTSSSIPTFIPIPVPPTNAKRMVCDPRSQFLLLWPSKKILTSSFQLWPVLFVFNDCANVSRIVMMRWRSGKRSCLLWRTTSGESFWEFAARIDLGDGVDPVAPCQTEN